MKIKSKHGLLAAAAILAGIFAMGTPMFSSAVPLAPAAAEKAPIVFHVSISDGRIWR